MDPLETIKLKTQQQQQQQQQKPHPFFPYVFLTSKKKHRQDPINTRLFVKNSAGCFVFSFFRRPETKSSARLANVSKTRTEVS